MRNKYWLYLLLAPLFYAVSAPNEIIPWGFPPAAFFAMVPLALGLFEASTHKKLKWWGMYFGIASTFLTVYWLFFFQSFSVWTAAGTAVGYALYFSVLFPAFSIIIRKFPRHKALIFALLWTGWEYQKSVGFLGFPWNLMAHTMHSIPVMIQTADTFGVWGISFLLLYINGLIAQHFSSDPAEKLLPPASPVFSPKLPVALRPWIPAIAILVLFLGYGTVILAIPEAPGKRLDVLLVQQNSDSWVDNNDVKVTLDIQRQTAKGLELGPVDVAVWSENTLMYPYQKETKSFFRRYPNKNESFAGFLSSLPMPLLTGTPYYLNFETGEAMNSVILVKPDGSIVNTYSKNQPVPFAESVPFWDVPAVKSFFQKVVNVQAIWQVSDKLVLFPLETKTSGTVQVATPICFEDCFDDLLRRMNNEGAEAFINLTNGQWSHTQAMETQHFASAQFRAVENRLPLIRSTNAGVTAIVDTKGQIRSILPLFVADVLRAEVNIPPKVKTFYSLAGNWFGILCVSFGWALGLWIFVRSRLKTNRRR
jgi:apolipoprotein N-acyltransferase